MICFGKRFRSFYTINKRSAGQRAGKSLAVKVGVVKEKSANLANIAEVCAIVFGPSSIPPWFESFSKLDRQ